MIQLKIKNEKLFRNLAKDWKKDIEKGLEVGMKAVGMHLTNEIKKSITKRSPGSTSATRYSPKRLVKVSPAGTSPNNDQGDLRGSIQWELTGPDSVIVGSVIKYGGMLEEGTPGGQLKARPYVRPTADREMETMTDILSKTIEKFMGARK
jgi:phage gpG-like protein